METGIGTKAVATLNNPQTVTALNMLKTMRWTDNSMGSNFDYGWSDINQAFAAGNVGMYISGSDVYTNLVSASNIDPSIYGLATIPLAKNKNAGVLGGGTLVAVRPDANARDEGGGGEVDRLLLRAAADQQAAGDPQREDARRRRSSRSAFRRCRSSTRRSTTSRTRGSSRTSTCRIAQMKPFTTGIFNQKLIPEPEASTQSVYHSLDAVVEAVLTNKNANIQSMLQQANSTAQAAIARGTRRQSSAGGRPRERRGRPPVAPMHGRDVDDRPREAPTCTTGEPVPASTPPARPRPSPRAAHAGRRGCAAAG